MNVTVEQLPESKVRLNIAADAAEHEEAVEKAYRRIVREITIPGFRKGKAPRSMIERTYGREMFVEEANAKLMDTLYKQAIDSEDVTPVGDPEVESIEPDPLSFVVVIPIYPTIDPGDYRSVRIDPIDASITEEQVEELINRMRLAQSPWVDPSEARKPRDGDQVTVDLHIFDGEEEFQPPTTDTVFVLGESNLLEELQSAIESLDIDGSTAADIPFPEDDDRYGEDDPRRGKTMTYNVTLKGIKEREELPLDDEFAKTYGNAESLEDLRERVTTSMHIERTREARDEAQRAIIEKIAEGATVEIPEAMVDTAVDERIAGLREQLKEQGASLESYLRQSGRNEDDLRKDLRPSAATGVRNSLVLREVAKREEIEISDNEIVEEIDERLIDVAEAAQMREMYLSNPYLFSTLRNQLYDQRLSDRLVEIATEGKEAVTGAYEPPAADVETDSAEVLAEATAEEPTEVKLDDQTDMAESAKTKETSSDVSESESSANGSSGVVAHEGSVVGDGSRDCPDDYPVKGNADSMLFHRPGDPSYKVTIPEFCFASADDATVAGYGPARTGASDE